MRVSQQEKHLAPYIPSTFGLDFQHKQVQGPRQQDKAAEVQKHLSVTGSVS